MMTSPISGIQMSAEKKLTVPEVIARFRAYHSKHPAWGALHVILDGHNTETKFVSGTIERAEAAGDTEGGELTRILLKMSRTQREKIAKLAWSRHRSICHAGSK